jgi:hypothetical protein
MPAHAPRGAHVAGHLDRRFVSVQQYAAQVRPAATAHRDTRAELGPARGDPPTDQVLGPGSPRPALAAHREARARRDPPRKRRAIGGLGAGRIASRSLEPRTACASALDRSRGNRGRCDGGRPSGCRCARRCADRTRLDAAASDARTPRCSTAVGVCWRLAGTRDHQARRSRTAPTEIWSQTVSRARWGGSVPAIARPRR